MKILSESSQKDDELLTPRVLPLIPLRDIVIFPFTTTPLFVGRSFSLQAIEEALNNDNIAFFVTQTKNKLEHPSSLDLYSVGTISEIVHVIKISDGKLKVLVEGLKRGKVEKFVNKESIYKAVVQPLDAPYKMNKDLEALRRVVVDTFSEYVKLNPTIIPDHVLPILNIEEIGRLTDSLIATMKLETKAKQELLSIYRPDLRLKKFISVLQKEMELMKISRKIDNDVRNRLELNQKKYFLNEKLRAIHKELKDTDEYVGDLGELKKVFKNIQLTKEAKEKVKVEIKRLESIPPMSQEYGVLKTYLEWIRDLPWGKNTKDNKNIKKAKKVLDDSHAGLSKVKKRILEFIAVRQLTKKGKSQILCFVGPPGVGKTSLAKAIAESLNRKFVRVSLGGVRDEAEIRGHRRTYVGALPGRIIQSMKKAKSTNPVFLLDEIDKMSTDFRGDPSSALLEVLDPEQNYDFSDNYLELPFDLSNVLFITTANSLRPIPPPLRDRMDIVTLSGYTELEKLEIAKRFLVTKQLEENGLQSELLQFTDQALLNIIQNYTREAGVREFERKIAAICRQVALRVVEKKGKINIKINPKNIEEFLEKPIFKYGSKEDSPEVGVVTGLAWTEAGGDVLSIEVTVVEGSGKLILTGKLGEVMQESAQTAFSYARSKIKEFGLQPLFYKKSDVHIHVPEGAVPKEGPSAGITIATALISALTKIPVKNDLAMTGEITLRGKVLPIGGVKEKVLSAHRSDIHNVILPYENKKNYDDIPESIRKTMKITFVQEMKEVLDLALVKKLRPTKKRKKTGRK